jgi:hypothetical protein
VRRRSFVIPDARSAIRNPEDRNAVHLPPDSGFAADAAPRNDDGAPGHASSSAFGWPTRLSFSASVRAHSREAAAFAASLLRPAKGGGARASTPEFSSISFSALSGFEGHARFATRPVSAVCPGLATRSCWLTCLVSTQGPWLLMATSRFSASAATDCCRASRFHAPRAMHAPFASSLVSLCGVPLELCRLAAGRPSNGPPRSHRDLRLAQRLGISPSPLRRLPRRPLR